MTDRLIRFTTALAVATVAAEAAVISYRDAYELVSGLRSLVQPNGEQRRIRRLCFSPHRVSSGL